MRYDCDWELRWHRKFAWFPVRIKEHDCRWLEYVERKGRRFYGMMIYEYRAPK